MTTEPEQPELAMADLATVDEVAVRLRVTAEQIRCLVRRGHLAAISVGTGKERPLYRFTSQAIEEFQQRRWQPDPAARVRRSHRRPPIRNHFTSLALGPRWLC